MGRQRDELSPIFLAFLRFLFGIFLKPVAWLHPPKENLTTRPRVFIYPHVPPTRGNEICLQIWFACHAQRN